MRCARSRSRDGLAGPDDRWSAVYRVAFDLHELATQRFLARVVDSLRGGPDDDDDSRWSTAVRNLIAVLGGRTSVRQNSLFLAGNSRADASVLRDALEAVDSSVCHTAVGIANGFMHAGTADDGFLREYSKFADFTAWQLFSAVVSLGVIHRGHETDALQLIDRYYSHLAKTGPSAGSSGYGEAGGLYALGLIHANHGADINEHLLDRIKDEPNEIVKHGGCLGIGLSAMGTRRADIYEQLKTVMHQDNAVFGEAIGLAIGLVMLGSNNSDILRDMVTCAHSTQHERILRGLAVGMSLLMYGRLEESDLFVSSLLQEKNPILRCSAMYTISMAYCGTTSKTAIQKLLHAANSDVDDQVRCAAVTSLGFLLFRTPEQCLQTITVLTKSYNYYVRYGAAMALGIACAGTGRQDAIDLLEPLFYDLVNYVRQGALIASALICIRQTESTCYKIKYFRSLYAKVITENYEDDVVKFGAILAQGIIDSGGRNVSISLDSRTGYLNTSTVVGLLLFTQYQFCICLAHCLTLTFTPTCTIGFDAKLDIPTFELKNSNKIIHEVCFNDLCQELAEKRGWIQYLFNENHKQKYNMLKKRPMQHEMFAYRFLIPKIVQDIKVIKDNWPTGHFFLQRITCHSESYIGVNCVQYDIDKIVSGLCDCTIKIWNKFTLECVKVLIGHTGSVMCLHFNEKMIISGSSDTTVRVWNVFTGETVCILTHHRAAVLNLRFSDNVLATCSKDCTIAIWDIMSPSEVALHCILFGHLAEVNIINFDEKYIVSGSRDCTIKVWNTLSCEFVRDLVGHYHGITCLQYKDRLVVSGSSDNTIRLWDIEYGACLRILENCEELVSCLKFNSKIIVSGAFDGKIQVWDLEAALDPSVPESCLCLRTLKVHKGIVYDLQFDEFQIISCSNDGTILLWDFLNYDETPDEADCSNISNSYSTSEIHAKNTSFSCMF